MKRATFILIMVIAALVILTSVAMAANITVKVDGAVVSFPDTKPYINTENRTLVPVRFVGQQLGATIDWNDETRKVAMVKGDRIIILEIDSTVAVINGMQVAFDTSAVITTGRTMVPLRFISEAFNCKVDWDCRNQNRGD